MRRQYNVLFESPDGIDEEKCLAEDEGDSSASGDMPAVTGAIEPLPDDKNHYYITIRCTQPCFRLQCFIWLATSAFAMGATHGPHQAACEIMQSQNKLTNLGVQSSDITVVNGELIFIFKSCRVAPNFDL